MTITTSAPRHGFIYVLRNACMPGIYVIGTSDCMPAQEAEEFSNSALIPEPFEIVCYGRLIGADDLKQELHSAFHQQRISARRDFFRLSDLDLIDIGFSIEERTPSCEFFDRHIRSMKALKEAADGEAAELLGRGNAL